MARHSAAFGYFAWYVVMKSSKALTASAWVAAVVWLEFQSHRISSLREVVDGLKIRVMGAIPIMPRWAAQAHRTRNAHWESVLTESVDSTRTLLLRDAGLDSLKVVMIASAMASEGKTTLSCHLGTSLARAGRRTLLVDCDLRRPSVHRVYDLPLTPGLCEVLRGDAKLDDALRETSTDGLWVLPGVIHGRKSLLLLSQGFVNDPGDRRTRNVVALSREANTAVYFIDVRGLQSLPGATGSAAEASPGPGAVFDSFVPDRTAAAFDESVMSATGAEGLASDTGGFSVRNTNDLGGGAERIAAESRVFYLLGFNAPEGKPAQAWRKLQVTTKRPGLEVRARKGYTLAKATNTTEPNGNGPGPNDFNQLGEEERGPSILDQRHRAVVTAMYEFPYQVTIGTVSQMASARPFNATTGVDNNGDGSNNDRPVVGHEVVGKTAFRGTGIYDTSVFAETRIPLHTASLTLRVETFNVFNHANILGRVGVYGNGAEPNAAFGTPSTGMANLDPGRMFQFQARLGF